MKTDSNKVASGQWPEAGVEQLLAEVEHAGRDERRRQELGDMIDRMAAAEGRRRGFWWWSGRVAAAACLLFFIGTAVRVWFIPTESTVDENLVAQAEVPEVTPVVADSTPAAPAVQHPVCERPRVTAEPTVVEEYVAEEVPAELMEEEEPVVERQDKVMMIEEAAVSEPAPIAQTESVETIAAPIVSVSNTSEQPVATAEERKSKRASIFKNIFRRHEPSKMDGTMLALNIL